ncbi:MAG: hypothetical protein KI789_11465 [Hoeflea sp.]|nr:hypothetical protein [Hoeflea sp.]
MQPAVEHRVAGDAGDVLGDGQDGEMGNRLDDDDQHRSLAERAIAQA